MRQITSPEELSGKCIKVAVDTADGLVLVFDDKTFMYASTVHDGDGGEFSTHEQFDPYQHLTEALKMGLVSQREHDQIISEREDAARSRDWDRYSKLFRKVGGSK